ASGALGEQGCGQGHGQGRAEVEERPGGKEVLGSEAKLRSTVGNQFRGREHRRLRMVWMVGGWAGIWTMPCPG
ncbi:MAG: hypothetical protein JG760_433, partial [Desulfomicrobiaceae bacterium]|nr:hypothetical protein [Desulfomicrobiaceae bacterium]